MPAKNPRLSVVLPPSVATTLAALAEESGESASSVVRGLLTEAEPALRRVLELVRAAKRAQGQVSAGVTSTLHRVVDDLEDSVAVAWSRVDRVSRDLVNEAEAVKGRRRKLGADLAQGRKPRAKAAATDARPRRKRTPA